MQHSQSQLVQTQNALAQAVRLANPEPLGGHSANRLAVYARLVRNNTFGFIDRCYVQAPRHLSAGAWLAVKEQFLQQGKAHSPYFQDIAGEFLKFCQQQQIFDAGLLALMDFENTQLLSEVAIARVPESFEWRKETLMQFSGTAFLKQYDVDFLSSNFAQIEAQPSNILVWRDSDYVVREQKLTELDYWLLTYLQEQPCSLNDIFKALNTLGADGEALRPALEQVWTKWINAEVIYPYQISED